MEAFLNCNGFVIIHNNDLVREVKEFPLIKKIINIMPRNGLEKEKSSFVFIDHFWLTLII